MTQFTVSPVVVCIYMPSISAISDFLSLLIAFIYFIFSIFQKNTDIIGKAVNFAKKEKRNADFYRVLFVKHTKTY
jgi:hypothetical protein